MTHSASLLGLVLLLGCAGPPASPDAATEDVGFDSTTDSTTTRPDATQDPDIGGDTMAPLDAPPIDGGVTPAFVEVALGFDHVHAETPLPCTSLAEHSCIAGGSTGGVVIEDYDRDGDPDFYFPKLDGPDVLYRNAGDGTFTEVASDVGLGADIQTNGGAFFDADGDGDLDLYVLGYGEKRHFFYIQEAGRFRDVSVDRGLDLTSTRNLQGTTVAFSDFDRDGDLDLHITEFIHDVVRGDDLSRNTLLRNRGPEQPGYFEDVTDALGVTHEAPPEGEGLITGGLGTFGYNSTFADFDDDGWMDLAIASDFGTSRFFWNDEGTFVDATEAIGLVDDELFGMGSAVGDLDMDGRLDWYITGITFPAEGFFSGNQLFAYRGDRSFAEIGEASGTKFTVWAWGTDCFDFDHDGDLDLLVGTGAETTDGRVVLFENDGTGNFTDRANALGLTYLGQTRGVASVDYDLDGDLDVVIVSMDDTPRIFRNDIGNYRASVTLRFHQDGSNQAAIGTRATLLVPELPPMVREVQGGGLYLSQKPASVHFGTGSETCPDEVNLEIRWPDGFEETRVLRDACRGEIVVHRAD